MKKYRVLLEASQYVEVYANEEDEAIAMALSTAEEPNWYVMQVSEGGMGNVQGKSVSFSV